MNNDKKFKERAPEMSQLFEARVSNEVIAKVMGISESTVSKDRTRVEELYNIKLPKPATSSDERGICFRKLLRTYVGVKLYRHNSDDPLYKAAKVAIDFESIDRIIETFEIFYERMQYPIIIAKDPGQINYKYFLEILTDEKNFFLINRKEKDKIDSFYECLYKGIIPIEDIEYEHQLIERARDYYCSIDRSKFNVITIDNPKEITEKLMEVLTEFEKEILSYHYGLGREKQNIDDIRNIYGLSRENVRKIMEKAKRKLKIELDNKKYLINSKAKYEKLKADYDQLNKEYSNYREKTKEIIDENEALKNKINNLESEAKAPENRDSLIIKFLLKPVSEAHFSIRIVNCLKNYKRMIDIIDGWNNLIKEKNFGKRSLLEIEDYIESFGINREEITNKQREQARKIAIQLD
jgi:DNA-binding Lrp family transcriptional regulator